MRSRFLIIFLLALGLLLSGPAQAQESISPTSEGPDLASGKTIEALITQGIALFTNERLAEALTLFQKIIDRQEEDPKGYFYKAVAYGVTMQDYGTRAFEREFNHYIKLAISKAEAQLSKNNDDAEAHFYLGGAYGYRGIDKTLVGNWFGAFLDGTQGVFHLKKAVALNPDYYDAYYGIGSYHYWVSAKASILWFVHFFSDKRVRGIEEIRLASTKGRYGRYEAKASLVTVLMNEKRWEEALKVTEEMLAEFPDDLSSRIQRGRILAELGRWPAVERDYQRVKDFLATRPFPGYVRKLEADYYLALAAHRQQRSPPFFERCLQVTALMGRHRSNGYIEGLAELEQQSRQLCGEPILLSAQE
ncbi:MAG: tetratricopeptide repeat protein [Nitrospinae bacterium]|nr:tetratricopeptide repeat protein [Nitrospinota bacterium]